MDTGINTDNLEEGLLYKFTRGVLEEIHIDPDDSMRKVRITEDAFFTVVELQKAMRKSMNGYKPDVSIVCTALIKHAAELPNAQQIVKECVLDLYQSFDMEIE